jgi:hypothetical protein
MTNIPSDAGAPPSRELLPPADERWFNVAEIIEKARAEQAQADALVIRRLQDEILNGEYDAKRLALYSDIIDLLFRKGCVIPGRPA